MKLFHMLLATFLVCSTEGYSTSEPLKSPTAVTGEINDTRTMYQSILTGIEGRDDPAARAIRDHIETGMRSVKMDEDMLSKIEKEIAESNARLNAHGQSGRDRANALKAARNRGDITGEDEQKAREEISKKAAEYIKQAFEIRERLKHIRVHTPYYFRDLSAHVVDGLIWLYGVRQFRDRSRSEEVKKEEIKGVLEHGLETISIVQGIVTEEDSENFLQGCIKNIKEQALARFGIAL